MTKRMPVTAIKLITAIALATVAVAGGGAQADPAAGTGPDNVVWLTTTGTNDRAQDSSTQVGFYDGDDLRSANVARSDSHDCTDCRTVTVAVQAVVATGHPHTVAPTNAAIAINERCERCTTYAYAYQYVVTANDDVEVSRRARGKVARIRNEIDDVAHSELAPADLDARLNDLTAQFKATIDAELKRQGEDRGDVHKFRDVES
jgi:hypothetical protein